MSYSVIGKNVPRVDALDKVLGTAKYADDMEFPDMLWVKMLTSPHSHAQILDIDTRKAEALPGVVGVLTHKDIPLNAFGYTFKDQPVLAEGKVRYYGEPVAAVAAETEDIAARAVKLIEVKYKELPAIYDPREALKPGARSVHVGGNLTYHRKIRWGDIDKGFKQSDEIFEDDFSTQWQEQAFLEPHCGTAVADSSGKVTIWSSVQSPFFIQSQTCGVLKMPSTKVRIIQTPCGGGFGGKNEITVEPLTALFALRTKRPVKMRWTREDEFITSTVQHRWYMHYKTGVKRDGRMVAMQIEIYVDNSPYTTWGYGQMSKGSILCRGPYNIPNGKVDSYLVYTNTPLSGALRAFGVVQVTAAREVHIDRIARELAIDPLKFRLRNVMKDGDLTATGQVVHSVGARDTMTAAAKAAGWDIGGEA
ncbi:MAG: xanthine dehydrogenase family protein molybdopterin-binding subunit [Candidatus Bathyarchaeia archaeon]